MPGMPGMQKMASDMAAPADMVEAIEHHASSGTSLEPNSTPTPMLMRQTGAWMVMLHGNVFLNETQQTGPRGADKFFSTNWLMPMAERAVGPGQLTVRAMLSLEPGTVTGERYPLLFEQGETAYGRPIVDGQHPHDLFMELGALYDVPVGERGLLSVYVAPVGDPAIGPTAYPHRASASEDPLGTLGHHQEDSTHIADDVVTVGWTEGRVRVEGSGFHGREPDEHRWNVDQGRIDSWAARMTVQPGEDWSGQYSYARIRSPEALFAAEDQERMTASAMYNRVLGPRGNWASTVVWGRTRSLGGGGKENSYLVESTLQFKGRNRVWMRAENAGRTNELLVGERAVPAGFVERPLTHVQAYTAGYDRELRGVRWLGMAVGAQGTGYGVGAPLVGAYGRDPVGVNVFVRLRP
ncbi:MAG TPA: hypothetical protein VGD62_13155, partial [Acidobacteriaceae bacterium]